MTLRKALDFLGFERLVNNVLSRGSSATFIEILESATVKQILELKQKLKSRQ